MLIESFTAKNIKFSIYANGSKFSLFVGGIKRATYPTIKGAQGAAKRIEDAA
jgi:hypothetical protein